MHGAGVAAFIFEDSSPRPNRFMCCMNRFMCCMHDFFKQIATFTCLHASHMICARDQPQILQSKIFGVFFFNLANASRHALPKRCYVDTGAGQCQHGQRMEGATPSAMLGVECCSGREQQFQNNGEWWFQLWGVPAPLPCMVVDYGVFLSCTQPFEDLQAQWFGPWLCTGWNQRRTKRVATKRSRLGRHRCQGPPVRFAWCLTSSIQDLCLCVLVAPMGGRWRVLHFLYQSSCLAGACMRQPCKSSCMYRWIVRITIYRLITSPCILRQPNKVFTQNCYFAVGALKLWPHCCNPRLVALNAGGFPFALLTMVELIFRSMSQPAVVACPYASVNE